MAQACGAMAWVGVIMDHWGGGGKGVVKVWTDTRMNATGFEAVCFILMPATRSSTIAK